MLGVLAASLVACGSSGKGLIPTGDAGPLQSDFEAVVQAAENGDGSCSATESALLRTEQDFYDLGRDYGPSDYSRKHMLSFAASYALPVGHGKTFLANPNPLLNTVIGGWNIGGIFTTDSGLPFSASR